MDDLQSFKRAFCRYIAGCHHTQYQDRIDYCVRGKANINSFANIIWDAMSSFAAHYSIPYRPTFLEKQDIVNVFSVKLHRKSYE